MFWQILDAGVLAERAVKNVKKLGKLHDRVRFARKAYSDLKANIKTKEDRTAARGAQASLDEYERPPADCA